MFDWNNPGYNTDPGTFKDICRDVLIRKGVLIPLEAQALGEYKGNKHKLLYSWSIVALKRIMQTGMPAGEKNNPMLNTEFERTSLLHDLKREIIAMRGAIGLIDNSMLFPIPFQYYHMVNMTVFIYLIFFNYGLAMLDSPLTLIIYPLTLLVVVGLLNTSNAMSDPFGENACDFNQEMLTNAIYDECKLMCEAPDEHFRPDIGDPACNPRRHPDGSLDIEYCLRAAASGKMEPSKPHPPKEVSWSAVDVQAIIDEVAELKEELRQGGLEDLTEKIKLLVDVNIKGFQDIKWDNQIPEAIQEANNAARLRVDMLEQLVTRYLTSSDAYAQGTLTDQSAARNAQASRESIQGHLPEESGTPGDGPPHPAVESTQPEFAVFTPRTLFALAPEHRWDQTEAPALAVDLVVLSPR
mmetsp:Transcript_42529/g.100289  ORF Transcript_42529/g.100289 Transcript_42529/m.100289 type:complete len:410 (+) Transcript_42529:395-1624(+)